MQLTSKSFGQIIKSIHLTSTSSLYLNLLRFFAAEFVLLAHLSEKIDSLHSSKYYFLIGNLGNWSVGIFFVLSGMLIGNSILKSKESNRSFSAYFVDRFSRIYSGLIPALAVVALFDVFGHFVFEIPLKNIGISELIINILMLEEFPPLQYLGYYLDNKSVWLKAPFWGSNLPLWTLAIEWWLYMLSGWLILRKNKNWWFWVVAILFSLVPIFQLFIGSRMGAGTTLIWALGFGLLMAINYKWQSPNLNKYHKTKSAVYLTLGCTLVLYAADQWKWSAFMFPVFLYTLMSRTQEIHTEVRPINLIFEKLAGFSFTLYLVHYSIIRFLDNALSKDNEIVLIVSAIIVSNLIAYIVGSTFETKNLMLRKQIKSLFHIR